jgi:hypothetical protein
MGRSAAQPRKASWPSLPAMLRVSAIVELATGCALLATPSVVIQALLGSPSNQVGWIVARILGGALLALGVAGMLTRGESPQRGVALAFIVYDTSTAVVLAWAGAAGAADGWLLWPVVGLHAILAAALAVGLGLLPGTDRKRSS